MLNVNLYLPMLGKGLSVLIASFFNCFYISHIGHIQIFHTFHNKCNTENCYCKSFYYKNYLGGFYSLFYPQLD